MEPEFLQTPRVLRREHVTILVDTREQRAYDFPGFKTEVATLQTGDYSLQGFEDRITIERKSLPDLVSCCAQNRRRFERELLRLRAYEVGPVVIEASWAEIHAGAWRPRVSASSVVESIGSWTARGNTFLFAKDRILGRGLVASILWHYARHEHVFSTERM